MPAASKSNIHGYIHGKGLKKSVNPGGVEENHVNSTNSVVEKECIRPTPDVTGDIGLQSLRL